MIYPALKCEQPTMRIVFVAAESELMEARGPSDMGYEDDDPRVAGMKPWTVAATTF